MSNTKEILCGYCDTPVKVDVDPKPKSIVSCPRCGNRDTFENVMGDIVDGLEERVYIASEESLERAFRGSEFIELKGSHTRRKKRRFYIKYKIEF